MAITFVSPKKEVVTKVITPVITNVNTEEEVDEYIKLKNKYDNLQVKELIFKMEELKKKLQSIANEKFGEDEQATLEGDLGSVVFSTNTKKLEVLKPMELFETIVAKFGTEVAFSVIKFGITELRQIFSSFELQEFTKETIGGRTLKSVIEK